MRLYYLFINGEHFLLPVTADYSQENLLALSARYFAARSKTPPTSYTIGYSHNGINYDQYRILNNVPHNLMLGHQHRRPGTLFTGGPIGSRAKEG